MISAGHAANYVPREWWPYAPMTAQRFVDLLERGGADDFFSSDLSTGELAETLGQLKVPTLLLLGDGHY